MARQKPTRARADEVVNAENVLRQFKRFLPLTSRFGATRARIKTFEAVLARGRELEASTGADPLHAVREALDDALGKYQRGVKRAAKVPGAKDGKLARTLRGAGFPESDDARDALVDGLVELIKPHAALLAEFGFGRAEQEALARAVRDFQAARQARPANGSHPDGEQKERERVFNELHDWTGWFRQVGYDALAGDPNRAAFDRVTAKVGKNGR